MSGAREPNAAGDGSQADSAVPRAVDEPSTLDDSGTAGSRDAHGPATPPPFELAPGTVVDGTYRIVRMLGAGGMGVVYLARDEDLQRDVALKVHRAAHGIDRLQREAIAMAQLAHPNVLTVHAVGQVAGRLYVAMEYVPGKTLRAWCGERRRGWREIVAMLGAAGEGLAAAHDAGFVHRDFKPENVLVGNDGRPRVGDFGLVRAAGDLVRSSESAPRDDAASIAETAPGAGGGFDAFAETIDAASSRSRRPTPSSMSASLTVTGAALGTPAYMAPEQFGGEEVDARADQFAFCVVLHEALCGRRPFAGATYGELRHAVRKLEPAPLPRGAAPAWIARVIRRGLARDPADRFGDLRALLAALRAGPRGRRAVVAGALAAAIAAAGAGWLVLGPRHAIVPPTDCAAAGDAVELVWSPARAAAVRARLPGVDPVHGAGHADRIVRRVDRWAARFRTVAEGACRAEHVEGRWSRRMGAQSRRCVARALAEAARRLAPVDHVERAGLPDYVDGLRVLPAIEDCADDRVLVADYQEPEDPAVADEAARVRDALEGVETTAEKGDVAAARRALAELEPRVRAIAFDPLTADYELAAGRVARREQRLDEAIAHLERAWSVGRAAGADAVALSAVQTLIWIHAVDRQEPAAARPWIVQALPEAERYGLDNGPAASVIHAAAVAAEIDADYDRALELHGRLLAAFDDTDDLTFARALGNYGATLEAAGRPAEAADAYRRALAIVERDVGPDAPQYLWIRSNLVLAQIATGDAAAAVETAAAAVAVLDRSDLVGAQEALNTRFNHAFALQMANRTAEAEAAYRALRGDQVALTGEDSIDVTWIDANLGDLLVRDGRPAEARPYLERAARVRRAALGEDHDAVADVVTNLGEVELATRGCAKAIPHFERAIAAYRQVAARGGPPRAGRALLGLARCRLAAGRRDEAARLAGEARAQADARGDADLVRDADDLLGRLRR